jgi:hypothetical protein
MTDSNIINFGDGPLTAQQRQALKRIRRDLQKMNLAYNDTQNLARAIHDLIGVLLPGLDIDEADAPHAKASG